MTRFLAICFLVIGSALPLQAQQKPVVVELFTSQGCSSCPPADELLHDLSLRDDVLPLSFHVDYWDYIGWKDSFGDPRFTKRQYAYAGAAGRDMVYTPQMIINGQTDVVGNRTEDVHAAVTRAAQAPAAVKLSAERKGGNIVIRAEPLRGSVSPTQIRVVQFIPQSTVDVTRGENAGKKLHYTNVVRDISSVGNWSGDAPLELTVPVSGKLSTAVLLQTAHMGPIISAALVK